MVYIRFKFQAGLAILDTRDLRPQRSVAPNKIISSFNFVCGSLEYQEKAFKKFLFGTPIQIEPGDMLTSINSSILEACDEHRNVIFVGHSLVDDLDILSNLGFNFQEMRVSACLDTYRISAQVFPYWSLKLSELLDELQCPYGRLHNGGNDATFTLRCLLLLAVKHLRSKGPHQNEDMLDYLEVAGSAPYA